MYKITLLGLLIIFSLPGLSQSQAGKYKLRHIDPQDILFGYEATFQDRPMLADRSMTFLTAHKLQRTQALVENYLTRFAPSEATHIDDRTTEHFKPGYNIDFANKESATITMEPGTIEWNFKPKTAFQLTQAWTPVYQAAALAEMAPYVGPAGFGGGGGHFHIGGQTRAKNPFVRHPHLLRNLMAYFHNHPAVLLGFSEAFDVGPETNSKTLHEADLQSGYLAATGKFDRAYKSGQKIGLSGYLDLLYKAAVDVGEHYSAINLEHIWSGADSRSNDKYTVEIRAFRPMPSPAHVESMAWFLLKLMDRLAEPGYLVPVRKISALEFNNFFSTQIIKTDWQIVKQELGIQDPLLDEMVKEYIENPHFSVKKQKSLTIRQTYSEYGRAGKNTELVWSVPARERVPLTLNYKGTQVPVQEVHLDRQKFAVAVYADDLKNEMTNFIRQRRCQSQFSR